MIDKTILLLSPLADLSQHPMVKWIPYLRMTVPFDYCFYQPMQKVFKEVLQYDYLERMLEIGISATNKEVIQLVRWAHADYVLWPVFGDYYEIREATLSAIRQAGSKIVAWFFDDEVRFGYYSVGWLPYIDYVLTNDEVALSKYRGAGVRAFLAIPDTGEPIPLDAPNLGENYEVSFVGGLIADRGAYIAHMKEAHIPVRVILHSDKFLPYAEVPQVFHRSKINLNFARTYDGIKLAVKGRIFKVCLAGGFLLTEYSPTLEKYFEIGKEIDVFESSQQMIAKISYYLAHDEERQAIARAGWERACRDYTSSHIIERVFTQIEAVKSTQAPDLKLFDRKAAAKYYRGIGRSFLHENYQGVWYEGLWHDAFRLSRHYRPYSFATMLWMFIGLLPFWLRSTITKCWIRGNEFRIVGLFILQHPIQAWEKFKRRVHKYQASRARI